MRVYLAEVRHLLMLLGTISQILDPVNVRSQNTVLVVNPTPHIQQLRVPVLDHVHVAVCLHAKFFVPEHVRLQKSL